MNLSISVLFIAGILHGALMVLAMMLAAFIICMLNGWGHLIGRHPVFAAHQNGAGRDTDPALTAPAFGIPGSRAAAARAASGAKDSEYQVQHHQRHNEKQQRHPTGS